MMCLQNRYRENFNFTFERLESAVSTITSMDNLLKRIKSYIPRNTKVRREFRDKLQESMQKFVEALENDIDSVVALTVVFDFITTINRDIDNNSLTEKERASTIEVLKSWDMVMGVMDWTVLEESIIPSDIAELANKRAEAKKNKDFTLADELRKKIE